MQPQQCPVSAIAALVAQRVGFRARVQHRRARVVVGVQIGRLGAVHRLVAAAAGVAVAEFGEEPAAGALVCVHGRSWLGYWRVLGAVFPPCGKDV